MTLTPRHPKLYQLSADRGAVELLFSSCLACGGLTFGADAYGCRLCGSEKLELVARAGTARLLACVELRADIIAGVKAPQAIGEVELAPDVIEEALLIGAAQQYTPGMQLVARAVDAGDGCFECRFEECSA